MKFLQLLFFCFLLPVLTLAQVSLSGDLTETIVDKINRPEAGKGSVKIIQDDKIAEKVGRPVAKNSGQTKSDADSKFASVSGWRIQVFSGNNQRVSKNEAFGKEADLKSVFPELSTYVKYNAPFWRVRVGDFKTLQEAQSVLQQLRHSFPTFGREMSIVKENVLVKVE